MIKTMNNGFSDFQNSKKIQMPFHKYYLYFRLSFLYILFRKGYCKWSFYMLEIVDVNT